MTGAVLRFSQSHGCDQVAEREMVFEIATAQAIESANCDREAIRNSADAEAIIANALRLAEVERFCGLFLDHRHRLIDFAELFRGTIGNSVCPRDVVKHALSVDAAAVILGRKNRSGAAFPSHPDERMSKRLKAALELVDVRLLDYVIVAGGSGKTVSLAAQGLI